MKTSLILIYFLLTFSAYAIDKSVTNLDLYSMAVAINLPYEKSLTSTDPEIDKIRNILLSAIKQSPTLEKELSLNEVPDQEDLNAFRALETDYYELRSEDASDRAAAKAMVKLFNKLVSGCASVKGNEGVTYDLQSKTCSNEHVTKLLLKGLDKMEYLNGDEGDVYFRLKNSTALLRDMEPIAEGLKVDDEEIDDLLSEFETLPNAVVVAKKFDGGLPIGGTGGPSQLFDLVDFNFTNDILQSLELKYWKGWGDCEMGCGNKHIWKISADKSNIQVSEEGSALP